MKSLTYKFIFLTSLFMLVMAASSATAQEEQRNMQKEAEIWKELASISPSSVETFKLATEAMDRGDSMEAIRRYGEVMIEAPDWDVVNRRLAFSLMGTGQMEEGLKLLRKAVQLKRSPENLISLAQMMAYPGPNIQTSTKDKEQALLLAKEASARRTDQSDASYTILVAQLALDLNNVPDFRVATKELVSRHQNLMVTHYFNAILAASDSEWFTAKQEIERAGQMGLPADVVESFLVDTGIRTRERAWRYAYIAGIVVLAWVIGLALLFVIGGILSKQTLRGLETTDSETLVSPEHDKLRSVYRKVINIAGLYYYISIPVVILLIVGVTGAIVYGIMSGGTIPVKLVLVLVIGAAITVFQIIKSLFRRQKQEIRGVSCWKQKLRACGRSRGKWRAQSGRVPSPRYA